jgi:predicted nuclease of restriction endonuclease-like (RecB) superfamily
MVDPATRPPADDALLIELRQLIQAARARTAAAVNSELTALYWAVGRRIHDIITGGGRAAYGQGVIDGLGRRLAQEFGRGFEAKNLRRMMRFAELYPDRPIVASLMRQLSWTHILVLIPLRDKDQRDYYSRHAGESGWSVRELRQHIERKDFERSVLAESQSAGVVAASDHAIAGTFKDPYLLDFLGLNDSYDEASLESAILRHLEAFILELGQGFTFVARQKRMIIDGEDFHLDLLFFHRRLRRLVAVELKLGRFQAAHKGQMELYLRWLDRHERQEGEAGPIGLILCAESSREQVELLEMHKDGLMVAEYWTELPPRAELERHLHQALLEARERMANRRTLLGPAGD